MNRKEVHQLVQKICPQIDYLDEETDELCEGECTIWGHESCTIVIEFGEMPCEQNLQIVREKLDFLNENRDLILENLWNETNFVDDVQKSGASLDLLKQAIFPIWIAFFVEKDGEIFCDFALASEPDYFKGRTAECFLEEDNTLIFNEWGG